MSDYGLGGIFSAVFAALWEAVVTFIVDTILGALGLGGEEE